MKKKYHHLTYEDRTVIKVLLQENKTYSYIARVVGVHRCTISREIQRNSGRRGYRNKQAQRKAMKRRAIPRMKKLDEYVKRFIIRKLRQDFSPEQISGISKKLFGFTISHESIYQLIVEDKKHGGKLYMHLRINGKRKQKRRCRSTDNRGRIKNAISIDKRPGAIERRKRIGDWEADLVSGANHKGYLVTLLERKSGLLRLGFVRNKSSELVKAEIIRLLRSFRVCTITYDNGKEFAGHGDVNEVLKCKSYFCHPYSAWERGSNENTNGLLRQYFPKDRELLNVTQKRLEAIEKLVNSRPRKRLGFKSPLEVYKRAS